MSLCTLSWKSGLARRTTSKRRRRHSIKDANVDLQLASNVRDRSCGFSHGRCHLLRMPLEIRLHIYLLVFQPAEVSLTRRPVSDVGSYKWGSAFGQRQRTLTTTESEVLSLQHLSYPRKFIFDEVLERWRQMRTQWSLLLTCRRLFQEASEIMYNLTTIQIDDPNVICHLAHQFSRHCFLAIRRLRLVWRCLRPLWRSSNCDRVHPQQAWDRCWYLVATEMNLLELEVYIEYPGCSDELSIEADWVKPMLQVQDIKCFHLQIKRVRQPLRSGETAAQDAISQFQQKLNESMIANRNGQRKGGGA